MSSPLYTANKMKLVNVCVPSLVDIFNAWVNIESRIIYEGMILLNNYLFYCIDNQIDHNIDTTLLRQCCMMIIDPDIKIGRVKINFKKPVLKKSMSIFMVNKIMKEYREKVARYKEIGEANRRRTETLKIAYNEYFPDKGLDKFKNAKCLTQPIENFSETFMVNIQNHTVLTYFQFQLRYLILITKDKLKDFEISDEQISVVSRYVQKRINLNEIIDFMCDDKFPSSLYLSIQVIVEQIIDEQIKLLTIERATYKDLNITKDNDYFYKKHYDRILKNNTNRIIKYYAMLSKYLTDKEDKSFSILPQLSLGYQHIMFDERTLHTIYNKWKGTNLTAKEFKDKYDFYYNEMFNVKKKCIRYYKQGFRPKMISTDGFSVSIIFKHNSKKVVKHIKKAKEDQPKIDISKLNNGEPLRSGIYDADCIICPADYLENYQLKGWDTGNNNMIYQVSEAERSTVITKGYYNEISHITMNFGKTQYLMEKANMNKVIDDLSKTTRNTTNYKEYNKYVMVYRKHRKKIWKFYSDEKYRGLKFDTYVNKRVAIQTIVRELVPKVRIRQRDNNDNTNKTGNVQKGKTKKRQYKKDKHFKADVYEKIKNRPTLIAVGKGNGNLTVNNTKCSSCHGPIKRIIKEISKVSLVVLEDENNSSQYCSICNKKLTHRKVIQDISDKKRIKEEEKKDEDINYITKMQRIEKGRELKRKIKEMRAQYELGNFDESLIAKLEKELKELNIDFECYSLCCCKNIECGHKLWHRDLNAARNILEMMKRKLTSKDLGVFKKNNLKKQPVVCVCYKEDACASLLGEKAL